MSVKPGTKEQYNKRHLMTSAFLTLRKGIGLITRSMVTDVEVSAFSECFFFFIIHFSFISFRNSLTHHRFNLVPNRVCMTVCVYVCVCK